MVNMVLIKALLANAAIEKPLAVKTLVVKSLLTLVLAGLTSQVLADKTGYTTLYWEDLVPEDFSTPPEVNPETIQHDPLALNMPLQQSAPVVGELNTKKVRIPGFAVPLEGDQNGITEFLLVPYMGACIHVPPPPTNQIVYVETKDNPLSVDMIYDAFWVTGTLSVTGRTSQYAETGYSMTADDFELYEFN